MPTPHHPYPTPNPSASLVASVFQIYLECDYFSHPHLLPPKSKPPSIGLLLSLLHSSPILSTLYSPHSSQMDTFNTCHIIFTPLPKTLKWISISFSIKSKVLTFSHLPN